MSADGTALLDEEDMVFWSVEVEGTVADARDQVSRQMNEAEV